MEFFPVVLMFSQQTVSNYVFNTSSNFIYYIKKKLSSLKIRCFPNFVKNGRKQNIVTTFMNFVDRFSSRRNVKLNWKVSLQPYYSDNREKSEVEKYFCGFFCACCRISSLFTEGWEKNHPLSPLIAAKKIKFQISWDSPLMFVCWVGVYGGAGKSCTWCLPCKQIKTSLKSRETVPLCLFAELEYMEGLKSQISWDSPLMFVCWVGVYGGAGKRTTRCLL